MSGVYPYEQSAGNANTGQSRGRVIDVDRNGKVVEHGQVKDVYCTRDGLQVGCSFITNEAVKRLMRVWLDGQ